MAIKIDHITGEGNIEVIVSIDGALDVTEEEYNSYLEELNESCLKFKEGELPTRFIMRKSLPYKLVQKLKSQQVRVEKGGEMFVNPSFMSDEVKYALSDIQNPPGENMIPYKGTKVSDEKGGSITVASDETMAILTNLDIVGELYAARKKYLDKGGSLKKS